MPAFIGLVHKDADSDFGVSFPDFPGLVTAGTDLDDLRRMAEEALALHVEGMVADGETIPEPSTLDAVRTDPENRAPPCLLVPLLSVALPGGAKPLRPRIKRPALYLLEINKSILRYRK